MATSYGYLSASYQNVVITDRPHPFGEKGVRSSLQEVAGLITKAWNDAQSLAKMREWAIARLADARTRGAEVDNHKSRARVLLKAAQQKLWVPDPIGVEFMPAAKYTAGVAGDGPHFQGGDCFPKGTSLLDKQFNLVPIEEVEVGTEIWGLDQWTRVEGRKFKGVLPVDAILLNNGSTVSLTPDHKVYIAECRHHPNICSCPMPEREIRRIRVADLEAGMVLTTPNRIPFGHEVMNPDRAYVEGLFISDGWSDQNSRFCISGKDGHPKEAQKKEVEKICAQFNLSTRRHERYIAVNDAEWTLRMKQMGAHAWDKHTLSLDLDEGAAGALLRGIMADSGANTNGPGRTFTTTSKTLAIQTRLLHKMFGVTCGWRYIENHGGFGTHPIYRLGVRVMSREDGKHPKLLRVKEIDRCVAEVQCYDIQTEDHKVYLPEYDVTVSNCDDLCVYLGALTCSVGIPTMVVGHSYDNDKQIGHVLLKVYDGKNWLYADPSTDLELGQCFSYTRERYIGVPSMEVICDATSCERKTIDPSQVEPSQGRFVSLGEPPARQVEWISPIRWISKNSFTPLQGLKPLNGYGMLSSGAFVDASGNVDVEAAAHDPKAAAQVAGAYGGQAVCAAYGLGAHNPVCGWAGAQFAGVTYGTLSDMVDTAKDVFTSHPIDWSTRSEFAPGWDCASPSAQGGDPTFDGQTFHVADYGFLNRITLMRGLATATLLVADDLAKKTGISIEQAIQLIQPNAPTGWTAVIRPYCQTFPPYKCVRTVSLGTMFDRWFSVSEQAKPFGASFWGTHFRIDSQGGSPQKGDSLELWSLTVPQGPGYDVAWSLVGTVGDALPACVPQPNTLYMAFWVPAGIHMMLTWSDDAFENAMQAWSASIQRNMSDVLAKAKTLPKAGTSKAGTSKAGMGAGPVIVVGGLAALAGYFIWFRK